MRRRTGFALIEVLVSITILAVMLTLTAGTLRLLLKLDRSGRVASEESADFARLARDFRSDAHAARPADHPVRPTDRLKMTLVGGPSVEYEIRPGDILRTVRVAEKVRHFETYRRPDKTSVRLDVIQDGPIWLASVQVDRPQNDRDRSLYHDYRIEAELGRDQRIERRSE